jgi:hypothetical protein
MSVLHSYRWRRRIAFTAVVVGVAAPLIWLGVRYSDPGNPENANGPTVADYAVSKNVPFTPQQRQQVHKVLRRFISTAVVRHNVADAWNIAGPTLKEGLTRKQWDHGDLPVIPFPALDKGWGKWSFVQYSYKEAKKHTVGLEVFLFPKPNSGWSAMTADVEVVRSGSGPWLVDYWMPKRFHGPPAVAKATTKAKTDAQKLRAKHAAKARAKVKGEAKSAAANPQATADQARVKGAWWALPLGLLGLAILLPLTVGGFFWYRNRKAERAYFRRASHDNPGPGS